MFVSPSMFYGGAERVMSILMNKLIERNYEVILILMTNRPEIVYQLNPKIRIIDTQGVKFNNIKSIVLPIYQLRTIVKNIKPNVIVSFFNNTLVFSWLAQIGLGIPVVFSERNDPYNNIKGIKAQFFQRIAMFVSSKLVFQTTGAMNFYKSPFIKKKSVVIYNPVKQYQSEEIMPIEKNEIVSVGRLSEQKNQKLLLYAFSKIANSFPNLSLVIYGEGELRSNLEKIIEQLNLKNRVFLPGNSSNVVKDILGARLFVFSSNFEGIPNVLLEAMSIGLPCISTDCSPGGAREFITNNDNGIIVPCNDIDAMANSMDYMLKNPIKAKRMGMNAKNVKDKLDPDIILDEWINLFSFR